MARTTDATWDGWWLEYTDEDAEALAMPQGTTESAVSGQETFPANQLTANIQVDDFLTIPAWDIYGLVIAIEDAHYGPDDAKRVLLSEDPEDETGTWYHLENGQFTIEA